MVVRRIIDIAAPPGRCSNQGLLTPEEEIKHSILTFLFVRQLHRLILSHIHRGPHHRRPSCKAEAAPPQPPRGAVPAT
jgi:hypothetical protein